MLVLSRHRDESIIIGDDIVITVVDIRGDKVRLGIAAPIEISVHRQEVYEAIQRENRQASRLDPQDARQIERLTPATAPARPAPAEGAREPEPNRSRSTDPASRSPPVPTAPLVGSARSDDRLRGRAPGVAQRSGRSPSPVGSVAVLTPAGPGVETNGPRPG